jgi:ribonuclease D
MLVDSEFQIAAAVQAICRESEIAVDCEGVDLSRTGKLCLVQIGLQNGTVFIFDITVLGALAFEIRMNDGIETLKTLLESPRILKIIFDVRNDSEALFHQYNVALTNVCFTSSFFPINYGHQNALFFFLFYSGHGHPIV